MKKITILVPVYNEEESLRNLYSAIQPLINNELTAEAYEWEVLLVNDGSRDNSLNIIKELRHSDERVNYVSLSRNFGKENAMLAGFDYSTGDCVIIMDADLQHPINLIPTMIEYWEGGYDDVYGKRRVRNKESKLRRALTMMFYRFLQKSTNLEMLPNVGDFRLLDRKCVNALVKMRETQRYSKGLFCWIGFKKKEVVFEPQERTAGKSSFGLGNLFSLAIDGVTSFSSMPLRFATILGFVVSMVSFVYILVLIVKTLIWGEPVQGYPSLMCAILFLGGCQLMAIGIIGEYIGKILSEAKARPPYIIDSFNDNRQI